MHQRRRLRRCQHTKSQDKTKLHAKTGCLTERKRAGAENNKKEKGLFIKLFIRLPARDRARNGDLHMQASPCLSTSKAAWAHAPRNDTCHFTADGGSELWRDPPRDHSTRVQGGKDQAERKALAPCPALQASGGRGGRLISFFLPDCEVVDSRVANIPTIDLFSCLISLPIFTHQ